MMSDEGLGLDIFIERNIGYQVITTMKDATGKERRLQLDLAPVAYQRLIVCCDTYFFFTKLLPRELYYVATFSLGSDKRRPEVDLLRLARERGWKELPSIRSLSHYQHCRRVRGVDIEEGRTVFGIPQWVLHPLFRKFSLSSIDHLARSTA